MTEDRNDYPSPKDLLFALEAARTRFEWAVVEIASLTRWDDLIRTRLLRAAEAAPFTLAVKDKGRGGGLNMTDWIRMLRAEKLVGLAWDWLQPHMPNSTARAKATPSELATREDVLKAFDEAIKAVKLLD